MRETCSRGREREKEERKGEKKNLALFVKEKEKEEIQTFLRRGREENHTLVFTGYVTVVYLFTDPPLTWCMCTCLSAPKMCASYKPEKLWACSLLKVINV